MRPHGLMSHADDVRRASAAAIESLDLTPVAAAAEALARALGEGDGLLHVLGCGHSQAIALEGYHRAGAPAWVAPVLDPQLSPTRGASGIEAERMPGLGTALVDRLPRAARALLVVSTSGRNAVPVEAAKAARDRGMLTIAITARSPVNRLAAASYHVLDTAVPEGDASIDVAGERMAPLSTVAAAVLLHCLLAETEARLGGGAVLSSVNVDGGEARNARHVARYPHLRP